LAVDVDLFITIAEIAGIFVGFGALINVTRKEEIEKFKLWRIRGLVTLGLGVLVAALLPIGLSRYGLTGHTLWFSCSIIYLLLNWAVSIHFIRKPEIRKYLKTQSKDSPIISMFFWLVLEVPFQASLILILLGLYPSLEPALYTTAIFFALFEAAVTLSQFVYSKTPIENK
jgi:hypothetical protein